MSENDLRMALAAKKIEVDIIHKSAMRWMRRAFYVGLVLGGYIVFLICREIGV